MAAPRKLLKYSGDKTARHARATKKMVATRRRRRADPLPVPDPVTSERLYSDEELVFLRASEAYRERYAKRFLTVCDYLHILKSLGYQRV